MAGQEPDSKNQSLSRYTLLYPPSLNSNWRVYNGRILISKKYRAWQKQALKALMIQGLSDPLMGAVAVELAVIPPDNRKRDIDNVSKPILDILTRAAVWVDDSQVNKLTITRKPMRIGGAVEITIYGQKEGTSKKESD